MPVRGKVAAGAAPFAPVPLFDTACARAGPEWARAYGPEIGRDWRVWHERSMRGMMADLAPRHPGWRAIWWEDLWPEEPVRGSGSRLRTWVAVADAESLPGGFAPAVWFTGWEGDPAQVRREYGAHCRAHDLGVAAYPGLLRESHLFTFGCVWQPWAVWVPRGARARVWRTGVSSMVAHGTPASVALHGLVRRVDRVTNWMRALGWTTRARLVSLAHPVASAIEESPWHARRPSPLPQQPRSAAGAYPPAWSRSACRQSRRSEPVLP